MSKEIKTSTGLIITFAAAVILGGGALTYYYRVAPTYNNNLLTNYPFTKKTADKTPATSGSTSEETTTESASSVKTYTSSQYGFSFQYPKSWTLNDKMDIGDANFVAIGVYSPEVAASIKKLQEEKAATEGPAYEFTFYYYPTLADADSNSPKKYTNLSDLANDQMLYTSPAETTLDGEKAYGATGIGLYTTYDVMALNNNHLYKLSFSNTESKDKMTDTQKQILASFKFE